MIALEPTYKGSKYAGASISITETIDNVDTLTDLTGADITMNMTRNGIIYATYKISDNSLKIETNNIIIPDHVPVLDYGEYEFDFSIIMPNGDPFNGVCPGTWEILKPNTERNATI